MFQEQSLKESCWLGVAQTYPRCLMMFILSDAAGCNSGNNLNDDKSKLKNRISKENSENFLLLNHFYFMLNLFIFTLFRYHKKLSILGSGIFVFLLIHLSYFL